MPHFTSRRSYNKPIPAIQIAPFVDVVLVLLIIFMVTAPVMITGMDVSLPEGSEDASGLIGHDPISITLDSKDKIYIDTQFVTAANLIKTVKNKTNNNFEQKIFIRSDKNVKYGSVMSLVNKLNQAGYKKTILVTENT